MGTEKEIQSDSSEHNAVITLTANAAAAGYKFYLVSGNETAKEATLVAGSNTINATGLSSDVIYEIKIAESDLYEKQATGYSFSYGQGW